MVWKKRMTNRYILIFYLVIIILIGGCDIRIPKFSDVTYNQKNITASTKKEQLLIKRFMEYWHYRQNGDFQKSWKYELPYQRYVTPYQKYKALISNIPGKRTVMEKVTYIEPNLAIIVRKVYKNKSSSFLKKDKWIYAKDNWYHKFYQTIFPPETTEEAEFQ